MDCAQKRTGSEDDSETKASGKHRVEIAASVLFGFPALASAYHTSVVIDGEEYFFSDSGICRDDDLLSHQGKEQGKPSEMFEVGRTDHSGTELWYALQAYFRPGTYDLLRKNCNSFTDAALFFLLRTRLDKKYSALERLGATSPDMVNRVTNGMYVPNAVSAEFNIEDVIEGVTKLGVGKRVTGPAGAPSKPRRMTLSIGAEVNLVGLKNAQSLNGEAARIARYNVITGRWEATLIKTGETKAFRAENLRPVGEAIFDEGDEVTIEGLKSEAGQAMNGLQGTIVGYLHDGARYEVSVNGETKALKSDNLRRCSQNATI